MVKSRTGVKSNKSSKIIGRYIKVNASGEHPSLKRLRTFQDGKVWQHQYFDSISYSIQLKHIKLLASNTLLQCCESSPERVFSQFASTLDCWIYLHKTLILNRW